MVDQISRAGWCWVWAWGGATRSSRPSAYPSESGSAGHARFVEIARAAWRGEPVVVRDGVAEPCVTPTPFRPGGPPLWIGALAEPAVRRAGRIADGFMACEVTPEELSEQVGWAREERAVMEWRSR